MNFLVQENIGNVDFIKQILCNSGFSDIQNIVSLKSGSRSFAYYADDYIVRFPKSDIIWQTMQREKNIIETIYPYLVPEFEEKIHKIDLIDGQYPFSISRRFVGKICDGRPQGKYAVLYQNLDVKQQERLAYELARFFYLMHQIDYKKLNLQEANETVDNWDVTARNDFDIEEVQKTLKSYKIDLDEYKIRQPNMTRALCHNDLSGSNILLSPEGKDILIGIIDFGNTIVMPKYQDFFPLYKIDRKLAVETLAKYNEMTASPIEQKQIDFMVLAYAGFCLAQSKGGISPYFMKMLKPFMNGTNDI